MWTSYGCFCIIVLYERACARVRECRRPDLAKKKFRLFCVFLRKLKDVVGNWTIRLLLIVLRIRGRAWAADHPALFRSAFANHWITASPPQPSLFPYLPLGLRESIALLYPPSLWLPCACVRRRTDAATAAVVCAGCAAIAHRRDDSRLRPSSEQAAALAS